MQFDDKLFSANSLQIKYHVFVTMSTENERGSAMTAIIVFFFGFMIVGALVLLYFSIYAFRNDAAFLGVLLLVWSLFVIAGSIFGILVATGQDIVSSLISE